ncbi:MAG: hypothetical protein F6K22_13800 [Okeania sp. SIO2F4]|uniref:hypothetical protein n=1 Tax=Okeania sp. SIO2F4 TaxID=2607790 RepID=UPI00142A47AE|nr:hypothetical protein [Okeania sp. SIO2F4]NES03817.1 hypothetical protein [Okeania sp. SIO2F4]
MPKSNQRQNKNKSQPDTRELRPIEIDETIVSGKTPKVNGGENLTITVPIEDFLQQIGAFQGIEGEDEAEQIHWEVFEQKLEEIFGTTNLEVNPTNLKKYLKYLKQNLTIPCLVTGMEEFEWEEHYTMGPGSKKEYQKLKKTQPSYTDKFNLLKLDNKLDVEYGILAVLERTTDNRKFTLPLADLETVVEDSINAELLEDYSMWFFTYCD